MTAPDPAAELLGLEGRVALVTGGSGGIGSAVVRLLHRAGARVLAADLPGHEPPPEAPLLPCDLGTPSGVEALLEQLGEASDRLDILVHCAGITRDAVLWKMDDEAWSEVLRVNLDSAFRLLRGGVPLLRRAGQGAVVLVSSINGERGRFGQANYAASKAGLIALARTAARELGSFGIRVNAVSPGLIETPLTASMAPEIRRRALEESVLGRAGTPEDVAQAVLYLVAPMARHVTGQVLRVDGGQFIA